VSEGAAAAAPLRRWIWIHGVVQGVGFRVHTRDEALRLGLTGTVRNQQDGSVEVCMEGSAEAVDALFTWCRRGPPLADVERVERRDAVATGEFSSFSVLR
jgi:acylphosphatase